MVTITYQKDLFSQKKNDKKKNFNLTKTIKIPFQYLQVFPLPEASRAEEVQVLAEGAGANAVVQHAPV